MLSLTCFSQAPLVDGVLAIVGEEIVLYSDLMAKEEAARQNGVFSNDSIRCYMLEDLLFEKLLLNQAAVDSVVVEEERVETELERRISYFVQQIGSEEKLEEFYGKSITQLKSEFRVQVREQLLAQKMQAQVTSDLRITPKDVEEFYNTIPEDSLPFINAEVEYAQLVLEVEPSEEALRKVKLRMEGWRKEFLEGKDFCVKAQLYSADPGSRDNCGELGMVPKGVMVPEFDAVALSLRDGDISHVFKTDFGYHIINMIERRGDQYNARHILLQAKVKPADADSTKKELNHIINLVDTDSLTFIEAVNMFSDDEESRSNNGMPSNPASGATNWEVGDLDRNVFYVLDRLQPGELSEPSLITAPDGTKSYVVFKLLSRTEPHRADLIQDYLLLKKAAESGIRKKATEDWISSKLSQTYLKLHPTFADCPLDEIWKSSLSAQ